MVTSKKRRSTSGVGGDDRWWPRTWRRSLVNVIAELIERGVRCECRKPGCSCSNDADLILADGSRVCGCCLVDCPDVHHDTDPAGTPTLE
jgi:hypothetical protein